MTTPETRIDLPTIVLRVDPVRPGRRPIERAARLILRGELVAFPTETVYGLGANALDPEAVARIFAAKGRPADDPLIVHLADVADLHQVAVDVSPLARDLAARFWPGPLTLVLAKAVAVPPGVTAGLATVAVRVPRHPVALSLLRASGTPIAAPSANLFSRPSPTRAEHVLEDLDGRVPLILDGGPTWVGVESTILDLTVDPPRILRPGGVTADEIARVLGRAPIAGARDDSDRLKAPGGLLKHYAPRAELTLVVGGDDAVRRLIEHRARAALARGERVGLLLAAEDTPVLGDLTRGGGVVAEILGSLADQRTVARGLFAAIRRLDNADVDFIVARDFGDSGLGASIRDRLTRAAVGRVILAK